MGQKTNPIGNRLGIIRGWDSNWFGGRDYGDKLAEDDKIRKYINARLSRASVSSIIIERLTVYPKYIKSSKRFLNTVISEKIEKILQANVIQKSN